MKKFLVLLVILFLSDMIYAQFLVKKKTGNSMIQVSGYLTFSQGGEPMQWAVGNTYQSALDLSLIESINTGTTRFNLTSSVNGLYVKISLKPESQEMEYFAQIINREQYSTWGYDSQNAFDKILSDYVARYGVSRAYEMCQMTGNCIFNQELPSYDTYYILVGEINQDMKSVTEVECYEIVLSDTDKEQNITRSYPIVGTNQRLSFDNRNIIGLPSESSIFWGQNSIYQGITPSYTDHGDGTISDNVTGLMWTKSLDLNGDGIINHDDKLTLEEGEQYIKELRVGGYSDWRVPSVKELYSLIDFSGVDISSYTGTSTEGLIPFIDTRFFDFGYGDLDANERLIDAQMLTNTIYTSTTMEGEKTLFGVNFADGRIKGYGLTSPKGEKKFYAYFVRGNADYGKNDFVETDNGIIVDKATGLMWMKDDSGKGMTWQEALEYAENYNYGGYDDWRLPNVKELQSIVDYDRSPDSTSSAAISPLFNSTQITNEAGQKDYPAYWSSTTHQRYAADRVGINACYVCFGRAMGYMGRWIDVHGAGAQRSDPKTGNPSDYPNGFGPQGDAIRIYNYVRLVRDADEN